ncbi:MAG: M13 family metallopeptidase [Hyphomonadaceae bacterium]
MRLNRRDLMATGLAYLAASCASRPAAHPPAPAPRAALGAWGVDLANRDLSIKPGDDFYRYANGNWLARTEIPPDRTAWGAFYILDDKADRDTKALIEELAAGAQTPGSNAHKIGDFYNTHLDVAAIDAKGLAPIQADLAAIEALSTHEETIRLIARPDMPVASPIALYISTDARNPDRYLTQMTHSGLGLPEREYYRRTDGQFPEIRAQYVAHIERMLTLAQQPDAARKARLIMALETQIAERHWPIAQRREVNLTYNLRTREQIAALDPRFPWNAFFEGAELGDVHEVVVAELSAMAPLARLFRATPVDTWKCYLVYHYLTNTAALLPSALDAENFAFYGHTLNGQPQQRERWRRSIDAVNEAMGEAIGEIYVRRHFPPESKAQMLALVETLRRAYGERIEQLRWMSPETKIAAREKLHTFRPKIGYPDKWRDYSALTIEAGDALGNSKRAALFEWRRQIARINQPTDRDEWLMTPQTVNAYYEPTFNEICFPAAILQPPFFDPNADLAVNYGGIGGVIGHEMGHGFDDQGAKQDAHGVLRDWWNAEDVARFSALVSTLATQYDAYEPLPGLHINGRLTLGENIGDNGGLQVAHYAYGLARGGAPAPDLDGLSGDQRFFLSWAQVWRTLIRDQRLRNQVLTDPHSPAEFRCNGVVRNMDAWYEAFNVQPGEKLYLPPEQRVLIW